VTSETDPKKRLTAAELAKEDLYFFSRWMFKERKGYRWIRGPHHHLICDALMRVYRGECRRLIINVPPRYSKTELAVVNFIAWSMGQVPDAEFIHASYAAPLAIENSSNVQSIVQHEAYREIFPECELASDAKSHWKTTKGGVMYAAGAGGTITGFGAGKHRPGFGGALIIDDPHKPDEAKSEKIRQGVIEWFQNTLESRKNSPDTPIILIMQRLHEKDLAGWLLGDRKDGKPEAGGNGETWDHLCLSAITDDGEALWPEKHSLPVLERMERANQYVFSGQYRQRPSPPSGGTFKPANLVPVDVLPAVKIKWVRGWDFADSTKGDYTVGGKLGKLPDGRFIIGHVERDRAVTDARDKLLVNTTKADGKGMVQSIPQDPGQAGKGQVHYLTKQLAGYRVKSSLESGDKETRADPFASQVNVGNVLILNGPWNQALKDEMTLFPNGEYDDQVDALSRAFAELMQGKRSIFEDI
jgi:predicted phage terminase large subunit-like protein